VQFFHFSIAVKMKILSVVQSESKQKNVGSVSEPDSLNPDSDLGILLNPNSGSRAVAESGSRQRFFMKKKLQ
jgi:hypothetical protein